MSDDYKVLQIMLYCVKVRGNGFRWFKDKDEAIFFASSYYNVDVELLPTPNNFIYEHLFKLDPDFICKFLNEREVR